MYIDIQYIYKNIRFSFIEMWQKFQDSTLGEISPPLMTIPGCFRAPIIIRSFWFSLEGCWHNAGALPQPYSCLRPNINNDREKEGRKEREQMSVQDRRSLDTSFWGCSCGTRRSWRDQRKRFVLMTTPYTLRIPVAPAGILLPRRLQSNRRSLIPACGQILWNRAWARHRKHKVYEIYFE